MTDNELSETIVFINGLPDWLFLLFCRRFLLNEMIFKLVEAGSQCKSFTIHIECRRYSNLLISDVRLKGFYRLKIIYL